MMQQNNMEMAQWKETVAEKRRLENVENSRKMEEMKQNLRQSQQQLESRIRQKEEHATKLRRAVEQRKVFDISLFLLCLRIQFEPLHSQTNLPLYLWLLWLMHAGIAFQPPMPLLVPTQG
jgi:hypothetical protein